MNNLILKTIITLFILVLLSIIIILNIKNNLYIKKCYDDYEDFTNITYDNENFDNILNTSLDGLLLDLDFSKINSFIKTPLPKPTDEYLIYNNSKIDFIVYDNIRKSRVEFVNYYNKIDSIVKTKDKKSTILKLYNDAQYSSHLSFDLGNTYINTLCMQFIINDNSKPLHLLLKCKDVSSHILSYIVLVKKTEHDRYSLIIDRIEDIPSDNKKTDFELIRDNEIVKNVHTVQTINKYRSEFPNLVKSDQMVDIDIIKDYIDNTHFIYYIYHNGYQVEQGNRTENLLSYSNCTIGEYFDGYISYIRLYSNVQESIINQHKIENIIEKNIENVDNTIPLDKHGRTIKDTQFMYSDNFNPNDIKLFKAKKGMNYKTLNKIKHTLDSGHIIKGYDEIPFDNRDCIISNDHITDEEHIMTNREIIDEDILFDNKNCEKIETSIAPRNTKSKFCSSFKNVPDHNSDVLLSNKSKKMKHADSLCKQKDSYIIKTNNNIDIIDMKENNTLCLDKK